MAGDPSKLGYYSLPGEVRNKIMDEVLVQGDVHICTPDSESLTNTDSQPGFQLTATCKQAYYEGHEIFYSSNTFHLPPTMTFDWSDKLQPEHKAMIKRIGITLGLDELTPAMIIQIDKAVPTRNMNKNGHVSGQAVFDALLDGWKIKMRHIAAWTSLEEIELSTFNQTHVLKHHEFVANLRRIDLWYDILYWRRLFRWPQVGIVGNIMA